LKQKNPYRQRAGVNTHFVAPATLNNYFPETWFISAARPDARLAEGYGSRAA
jgi:hypothetical protein